MPLQSRQNPIIDPDNLVLDADSYKASHYRQYPPQTRHVQSYIEPRAAAPGGVNYTLFFGLQAYLQQYLSLRVTSEMVEEADQVLRAHGEPFNRDGWQHIVDRHDGRLPVRVKAVREGSIIPVRHAQLTIENTDPACYWLTSYLETSLLRAVWYPTTVATNSWHYVQAISDALELTDGSREGAEFKLVDFGARGATSKEQTGLGGMAHMVASLSSDTLQGLVYARNFYDADMAAFSIPASEHSTMTCWGGEAGEAEAFTNMLRAYPTGLISVVSDSYDLMRAINQHWGETLRQAVLDRDGVLVVRPDSGEPTQIVPQVIEALMDKFGYSTTTQGYRLLNDKVRVIQGDGIDGQSLVDILDVMKARGLAIGNITFGMGGGLLQKVNRDTFSYAMKANAVQIGKDWHQVYKDPVTSQGTKTSKRGRLALTWSDQQGYVTHENCDGAVDGDLLETVFEDGEIKRWQSFDEVKAQARTSWTQYQDFQRRS